MYRVIIDRVQVLALVALATACTRDAGPAGQGAPPAAPEQAAAAAPEQAAPAAAATSLGAAPDFTLKDLDGNEVSLASFRGKTVVLEWFNPGCPFVQYAHSKGPLAGMAARATAEGVVWLSINSGAPGKQGHGVEVNREAAAEWNITNPLLVDESGEVGKAYGARTTPHMYIIDRDGQLVYRGAIDNAPMGDADGATPVNHVEVALAALAAGKPIETPETKPYGCSVKYAN